jgi:hypothetical protein
VQEKRLGQLRMDHAVPLVVSLGYLGRQPATRAFRGAGGVLVRVCLLVKVRGQAAADNGKNAQQDDGSSPSHALSDTVMGCGSRGQAYARVPHDRAARDEGTAYEQNRAIDVNRLFVKQGNDWKEVQLKDAHHKDRRSGARGSR